MSGIYGYSLAAACEAPQNQILGGLQYWNRIYGREAHGQVQLDMAGIGCHVEHFSERYPHAEPVLENQGRYWAVDALLYNREELLTALDLEGECSISDEELLLKWIETKGFDALSMVNGDFAGAIYDPEAREWTLFRDHMGMRPLYLYMDSGFFAFSTDIRGLLSLPQVDPAPNEERLFRNFIFQPAAALLETEYAHIHFARPAAVTTVRVGPGGFRLTDRIYWKLRSKKIRLGSDEAYQKELYRLIADSVKRRLDAFPGLIGAELSGGFDSGVIDILINRFGRDARYISWSAPPNVLPLQAKEDERHVINDICAQEGIECIYMYSKDKAGIDTFLERAVPPSFDTPTLGFGSALLNKQGVRVMFTGHGGDEGVSHRCNRLEPLVYREYLDFYRLYLQDLEGVPLRHLKAFKSIALDLRRLKRKISFPATEEDLNDPIFTEGFRTKMKAVYTDEPLTFAYDPLRYIMSGATQHRVDNASYQGAFNGVRYVYPYLDHRVIDYALSIPRAQYLGRQNRRIFREAFREIIPESLYRLNYKDFASRRGQKTGENFAKTLQKELEWVIESLDRSVWGEILDFAHLSRIDLTNGADITGNRKITKQLEYLERLLIAQNAREKALKWREFDERNILL